MLSSKVLTQATSLVGKRASSSLSGLSFDISDDLVELQKTARVFVKQEIMPHAGHYDKTMEYPWPIIKKAHEAGLLNTQVPEKFGGAGMDLVAEVVLGEAVGYGCTGIGTV
jgi:acyl-CoA dehydrogenase